MKILKSFIVIIITIVFVLALNMKIDSVPPIGKFLNPFGGFWNNSESTSTIADKKISLNGLIDEVTVKYDSLLIPHIFAKNDHDLYMAQGYVTAQHRLWQMEFQTHAAAGRLSEILGENPSILKYDRLQRRQGMVFGAKKSFSAMSKDKESHDAVVAYTKGVNAYINSLSDKKLPIEYKLLDYKPEAWTSLKSALLLKYMAKDLAGRDYDLENTNVYNMLGKEMFELLFPIMEHGTDPIIPNGTKWAFEPLPVDSAILEVPKDMITQIMEMPDSRNGSNNWAVSGKKTKNGHAILSGDPHLHLSLPSIWFAMQLNTPEINTMGVTLPGALGIIIGFNDSIAWSETNSRRDVRDWYKITFKDDKREVYLLDDKWLKTTKVIEEIKVKGAKNFYDTVVYTHHGPVVYDENFLSETKKNNYALRWVAHESSNEQLAFLKLNKAKNYDDYVDALQHYQCPAQNFVFASTAGDIAIWATGKYPLKWKHQGEFLMDGSKSANDWQGFIPFKHGAQIKNPTREFVSSANQFSADSTYPYFAYDGNFEHYRNRRINQRLGEMKNIMPKDMMSLQNDNYNLRAAESLPTMLIGFSKDHFNSEQLAYFNTIKNWNYMNNPNSKGATIYKVWWKEFRNLLWDEFESENGALRRPSMAQTIYLMKNNPSLKFTDVINTPAKENFFDVLLESFKMACTELDTWKTENDDNYSWGKYKNTRIDHLIPTLKPFSFTGINNGGGSSVVNATGTTHGPSWRMVVELEKNNVKAWAVYPGGQSGNPGSPFYDNYVNTWESGEYFPLQFMHDVKKENKAIIYTETFNSVKK